jgi:hypothetical protein
MIVVYKAAVRFGSVQFGFFGSEKIRGLVRFGFGQPLLSHLRAGDALDINLVDLANTIHNSSILQKTMVKIVLKSYSSEDPESRRRMKDLSF